MHELGIVFNIIRNVKDVAKENNVKKIKKVTLEIGEVSMIIPDYLLDCYKWATKDDEILKDSSLVIEIIEGINHCSKCGMDFKAKVFGKVCPNCQSNETYLISGNETIIKNIEC